MPARPAIVDVYALGRRIAEKRQARGWRQQDMAQIADVGVSQLARWEIGYQGAQPSIDNLVRVANALEVTLDWLVGRTTDRENGPEAPGPSRKTSSDVAIAAAPAS